jgi:ferredoxin
MKIKVNKEKCIGCGYCVSVCPEVFELGEDGKSRVKENADFEKNKDCIEEAKKGCPVGAIEE